MAEPEAAIYFWKPSEKTYGYLSQWFDCPFEVDGVNYAHTEMWMMVQKARLFGDENIAQQMMKTPSPAEHQRLGRQVQGFSGAEWSKHKSSIVEEGNYYKFTRSNDHERLARLLHETGDRELVEASPVDRIWGVGFAAVDAEQNRSSWGENRLGKAIMSVRQRLRNEQNASI